jgi:phosphomannomutase/phosphoglucomutase
MALFGTNGVRGIANKEITPGMALDLARSLGTFLWKQKKGIKEMPAIVIGTDTRVSGTMLKNAAISGALSCGCAVIDVGIVPTPALQYYVKTAGADGGIVITASHNPREDNGLKIIAGDGTEFSRKDEKAVEKIYFSKSFMSADGLKTGNLRAEPNCNDMYMAAVVKNANLSVIKKRNFKVITDTGCGAGSPTLPFILRSLGCDVLTLGAQPDGTFPWRNPEPTVDALKEMSGMMRGAGFDLGIAQDGDADRAVFLDENGEFIDEEVMLAAVGKFMLQKEKGPIVTTVSTSKRLTDVAKAANVPIYYTQVGSIDVARKMTEVSAVYGGEGNGGFIFPKHQTCRDGAMAAAIVLEMLAVTKMKASDLKKSVPAYANVKIKIQLQGDLKKIMADLTKKIKMEKPLHEKMETIDGIKLWFKNGWVLIRPSGTKTLIRVVAEAKTKNAAQKYAEIGKQFVLNSA